jgi:hypothetical protein
MHGIRQFNAVSLALSLLDESSLGSNRREFEEMKHHIESSLQGTVDGTSSSAIRTSLPG